MNDSDVPRGSRGNPSVWGRRLPLAGLALVGAAIAVYLTLFQVGAVLAVWDPVFGYGSVQVLRSGIARSLPLPDAALGVMAYLLDAVLALVGGPDRWRTMPAVVLAYGLVMAGLVGTALVLVAMQLFVVHAGCMLCLASAAISLTIGWLARDEIGAAAMEIRRQRRDGVSMVSAVRGRGGSA